MIGYKLTDADGYTRRGMSGETLWSVGATVAPTGKYNGSPCGPGCLHYYGSAEEAVIYAPIHAEYGASARLFRIVVGDGETDGLKWWTAQPVVWINKIKNQDFIIQIGIQPMNGTGALELLEEM